MLVGSFVLLLPLRLITEFRPSAHPVSCWDDLFLLRDMGIEAIMASKVLSFGMASRHKRSKSFPEKNRLPEDGSDASPDDSCRTKQENKLNKKPSLCSETYHSLKQEIMLLQKRLQDQFKVRHALKNALGYRSCRDNGNDNVLMPKPATVLIKEIATLELEVAYLEQYLLTLYRKAFDHQVSPQSTKYSSITNENPMTPVDTPRRRLLEVPTPDTATATKMEDSAVRSRHELANGLNEEEKSIDPGVQRCHSTLSQCSVVFAAKNSPSKDSSLKAVRACHSQPMSMLEYAQNSATSIVSLAEYLGTNISDHVPETANKLSEDMVRCMSVIYCKLADSSPGHQGSSLVSSSSSKSGFSPQDHRDPGIPGFRNVSSFETRLDNPFHVEGLKEFSGPYSMMIEVPWIYGDSQKLGDIEPLLQKYRSFISRLEEVDLRRLKHEEKLAFWINIHNSLVMHVFLAYGIPQNNMRRTIQLLKAAYNVGGHTISADTIQATILRCRMSRPGQWIRLMLSTKKKYKNGDKRQVYVVERPEPLLHFALCYGSHSDPVVRVYSPRNLSQELENAKEEYIRATFGLRKDKKILLPKVVESFAKDSGMCPADVIEMVRKCLPDAVRKGLSKWPAGKASSHKSIEWIPYNFNFRYLISKELSK